PPDLDRRTCRCERGRRQIGNDGPYALEHHRPISQGVLRVAYGRRDRLLRNSTEALFSAIASKPSRTTRPAVVVLTSCSATVLIARTSVRAAGVLRPWHRRAATGQSQIEQSCLGLSERLLRIALCRSANVLEFSSASQSPLCVKRT